MPSDNFMAGDPLSLERIRSVLVRLEDTIIFSLIERAQFAHNPHIYQRGAIKELQDLGFQGSWLEWFLKETEIFHGMYVNWNVSAGANPWYRKPKRVDTQGV
jgi:chorismate mutase